MNLAILHHHLNPGGVTRVVENHLRALAHAAEELDLQRVLLVHGGRAQGWPAEELAQAVPFVLESCIVEGLDYALTGGPADEALAGRLAKALGRNGATPDGTILHWHNHALGKNAATPLAVERLATDGYRLLLQVHDFAEDFRPTNYRYLSEKLAALRGQPLPDLLYPQGEGIHYAVLNGRDREILRRAGVDEARLWFLPNPAVPPGKGEEASPGGTAKTQAALLGMDRERALVVYPVRGIRRKNLGEMLLWSAAAEEVEFLVTLPPKNPLERASFDRWEATAKELQLPCHWGAPAGARYEQTLAASDALLTTSVAEGFGMIFLEGWLAGRPLVGRDLPEITADFKQRGLDLQSLYQELVVPSAWIDRAGFGTELGELIRAVYAAFGAAAPEDRLIRAEVERMLGGATIDFARLTASQQIAVIRRAADSSTARGEIRQWNPLLAVPRDDRSAQIASNAAAAAEHFSLAAISAALAEVYRQLLASHPSGRTDPLPRGEAILEAFLGIDRLHPIRVEL